MALYRKKDLLEAEQYTGDNNPFGAVIIEEDKPGINTYFGFSPIEKDVYIIRLSAGIFDIISTQFLEKHYERVNS